MSAPDANGWMPIETAPKDGTRIAVFGLPESIEPVSFSKAGAYSAHWDTIDDAFCLDGGTWLGPFIEPTHWQHLPKPPVQS